MRVFGVNTYHFGSTGTIMNSVAQIVRDNGGEAITCATKWRNLPKETNKKKYFGFTVENLVHFWLGKYLGLNGRLSWVGTMDLCLKINKFKPDIVHLNNVLSPRICLPFLFKYLKKKNIPIVWTLHDCWAFTGHCTHFLYEDCYKWKDMCFECPLYRTYPSEFRDYSRKNFSFKRKLFTSLENITIVTPSYWLASMVNQSFLNKYDIKTIHNGVDLTVFKPQKSELRTKYNCNNKYIILGVAFAWDEKKGIDIFQRLAKDLSSDYQIILIGDYIGQLDSNIIHISRTDNVQELAEYYSSADVFVNPTREEVLGLVNIESLACGTPVVAFDSGGCSECVDNMSGIIVDCDNYDDLKDSIVNMCEKRPFSSENCIRQAQEFDKNKMYNEYYSLFCEILEK